MASESTDLKDSLIGTLLDDKYRIEKVLGQGGMAKVYLATQEPLGRKVAVKVLKHMSTDPDIRNIDEKRFFREASLASKLTHPNTVVIHDYGTLDEDKGLFLVMEYLDGTSLGELLRRVHHLSWETAYPIISQIAGSLAEAHEKGLIHRDLKPLNIMVSQKADSPIYAKVLDFGLAKPMEEADDEQVTVKGTIIGSPLYMSPEQIFNEDVDHRSDIYSLGILSYEMLTGRPPFILDNKGHVRDLLKSHLTGSVPEMRSLNESLDAPTEVEFAIRRCLAKKGDDRFDSVKEFMETLKNIQGSSGHRNINETANFTHHQLLSEPQEPPVDSVAQGQIAFSTTTFGSSEEMGPVGDKPRRLSTRQFLVALAAVLALGIGLTVALSSDTKDTTQTVPQEDDSLVVSTKPAQATKATHTPTPPVEKAAASTPPKNAPDLDKETRRSTAEPEGGAAPSNETQPPTATIQLVFDSQPSGAKVFRNGEEVGDSATPFSLDVPRSKVAGTYTFKKRGFVTATKEARDDIQGARLELTAELQRVKSQKKRSRPSNVLRRRKR